MGFDEWARRVIVLQDDDGGGDNPHDVVAGLTELMTSAGRLTEHYTTREINDGLWHLAGSSDLLRAVYDERVEERLRLGLAASIRHLFADLFAPRCENAMSFRGAPEEPLNSICYMWWDVFPSWGRPENPAARAVDAALLGVMRGCLELRNFACVESGLHGLGHWYRQYPAETAEIIGGFLREARLPPALLEYARAAKRGSVL